MRTQSTRMTVDGLLAAVGIVGFAFTGLMWFLTSRLWGTPAGMDGLNPFAASLIASGGGVGFAVYRMVVLGAVIGAFALLGVRYVLAGVAVASVVNVAWWIREWVTEGPAPVLETEWALFVLALGVSTVVALGAAVPRFRPIEVPTLPSFERPWLQRVYVGLCVLVFGVLGLTAVPMVFRGFTGWF